MGSAEYVCRAKSGAALFRPTISFLVTPSALVPLHRIRNDELYHYYLGDRVIVGPDLRGEQHVRC
jgi:predicted cupin superfamily sugar epimerase